MMAQMKDPGPISDLLDFYERWPSLRTSMESLSEVPNLAPEQRETLSWLILLADRVGPSDLAE